MRNKQIEVRSWLTPQRGAEDLRIESFFIFSYFRHVIGADSDWTIMRWWVDVDHWYFAVICNVSSGVCSLKNEVFFRWRFCKWLIYYSCQSINEAMLVLITWLVDDTWNNYLSVSNIDRRLNEIRKRICSTVNCPLNDSWLSLS